MTRRFVHLSDLHLGLADRAERAAKLVRAALAARIDRLILTGDVTHRGRRSELDAFREIFRPLLESGRVTVVPGNHDRMTDDVRDELMPGDRVQIEAADGLHLVRVDTTAPHNAALHRGHGVLDEADLDRIENALRKARPGAVRVLTFHHHPLPLPPEDLFERITCAMKLPWCAELQGGRKLLARVRGLCDLLLHGHRHVPAEQTLFPKDRRPLWIFNAGSSTELMRARLFELRGHLLVARWLEPTY